MSFRVVRVIDGDTFKVAPDWSTRGEAGDKVRIANLDAPELPSVAGFGAKHRLEALLRGQIVNLYAQTVDDYGRLVAEVFLNGQDVLYQLRTNRMNPYPTKRRAGHTQRTHPTAAAE